MNKLKRNLIFQIGYQILIVITPILTSPYVSRVLGAEKLGIYSYTYSLVNYFTIFAMLGVQNYGSRSIASSKDDKIKLSVTFSEIVSLQWMTAILALIGYGVYLIFFCTENMQIAGVQSLYIIACLFNLNWFFFGLEEFQLTVIRNVVIKVISIIGIFVLVHGKDDLWKYVLLLAGSEVLSQVILLPKLKKYTSYKRPQFRSVLKHVKPNIILFIPTIAYSISHILDKTMIGIFSVYEQNGFYYNIEKVINIPKGIIFGIGVVMMPRMSNNVALSHFDVNKKYLTDFLYVVSFLTIGMSFGLSAIAKEFVPLFFGDGYTECIPLMGIMSFALIFMSLSNLLRMQYLIPNKKDVAYAIAFFCGAIINVVINLMLIPDYGAMGAAVGTICSEIVAFLIQLYVTNLNMHIVMDFIKTIVFGIPACGMVIIIRIIANFLQGKSGLFIVLIEIIVGGSVYIVISSILLSRIKPEIYKEIKTNIIGKVKRKRKI